MSNANESKIKKAIASVLIVLAVSITLTSSITLAQTFDKAKSTVIYCSQPLKVPAGSAYDYQYFAYVSKTGTSDLIINIDKGSANSLENLYPGSHAQLSGKQITINENTSFILHNLGGSELSLTGGSGVQFAPSEKCDELVATMTAINGYSKQTLADKDGLILAQTKLVETMTAVMAASTVVNDVVGYEPTTITPETPATPYQYSAEEIVKYLEDNGYRGQKFLDDYSNYLIEKEKDYSEIKGKSEVAKESFLKTQYNAEYLEELRSVVSEEKINILEKLSNSFENPSVILSDAEMKQALDIFTKEKIIKVSSTPQKWVSLAEYLSIADEGLEVEYKIISEIPDKKFLDVASDYNSKGYNLYTPSEETVHLQVLKKGTNIQLDKIPIFPAKQGEETAIGSVIHSRTESSVRIMKINMDKSAYSLQRTLMVIVHESSHETTLALNSYDKLHIGNTPKLPSEGLAEYDELKLAKKQHELGISGYDFESKLIKKYRLRANSYKTRIYGEGTNIYEFITEKLGGQNTINEIKKGNILISSKIDINGLDSIFRINFLTPLIDELNAQNSRFIKILEKEKEITDALLKDKNPSAETINRFNSELDAIMKEINEKPLGLPAENDRFKGYVNKLKFYVENHDYFEDLIKIDINEKQEIMNSLSEKTAEYAKVYGNMMPEKTPSAEFKAVENAANDLLEKTKKIKELGNNVLNEKSLQSLNSAENSILKNKVPEELTKTAEVAKKSASGATAIAAGTTMVFALGSKFVEYGQDNNNPYLIATGETIEYSGQGLLVASAGATVAQAVGIVLPQILKGLVLTSEGFLSGTVIGLLAVAFIEMAWCVVNPFGALCFGYIQPILTLSKTKGFAGEKITYEISGFDVKNGIGNQEGKKYTITYQGSLGLQLGTGCTVSGDKCNGEFAAPSVSSDTIKIFAQDLDNTYKSTSVTFEKLKNQLTIGATVVTDKSYLCMYTKEWKGETDLTMTCTKV